MTMVLCQPRLSFNRKSTEAKSLCSSVDVPVAISDSLSEDNSNASEKSVPENQHPCQ